MLWLKVVEMIHESSCVLSTKQRTKTNISVGIFNVGGGGDGGDIVLTNRQCHQEFVVLHLIIP